MARACEPLEFLRVFQTLEEFYKTFRRARGQEFVAFDTSFRSQLKRLDEIGASLSGITKAFWFLETAAIAAELRKQVVAAAGGVYDYEKLRAALVAIVPQVSKTTHDDPQQTHHGGAHHGGGRSWKAKGWPIRPQGERRRSGRAMSKKILPRMPRRISLTSRPSSRCWSHRPRRRDHRWSELEVSARMRTPREDTGNEESHGMFRLQGPGVRHHTAAGTATLNAHIMDKRRRSPRSGRRPVFAVTEEDITDSEESFDVYVADLPGFSTVTVEDMDHRLALADTYCARTVAGSSKEASNW